MNWLQQIMAVFRTPTAEAMAVQELAEAKRGLLQAQSAQEYAAALIQYNSDRVSRLTQYIKEST